MTRSREAEQFAARLRMLKDRADLSFEELARRTGISRSSLHRYCSGAKLPPGYGTAHTIAKACGASGEELRELHKAWALADAARSASSPGEREIPEDGDEPRAEETGQAPPPDDGRTADEVPDEGADAGTAPVEDYADGRTGQDTGAAPEPVATAPPPRVRRRVLLPVLIAVASAAVTATAFTVLRDSGTRPPAGPTILGGWTSSPKAVPIRVYNAEAGCRDREDHVPACSLGLARDPRRKYEAANVVGRRVWHDDVVYADCLLYDGTRVIDEFGVATTRWFRVRLDGAPGGVAWLPAVRTMDGPALPTCA
ncbi:hypothetical protein Ssi03_09780 [Sphaerisporangium siamense]|uniref:Transcriptional regulator with XRE-family HTH domain n=1 Tax=Sphaerisporangium siamense TaxID=795645 RepID=A0A7W7DEZ1_9ACTN|nr:helix-turn-helix transcriptional regulator [Sphaerisporangium siamense]MBB4705629.1 transcriptional regulator with XRE-family HTH domain [Sphaerisporangium siamense]GII82988.1 hypothetical protein Ssi03_09780 [Sphaerisporangium siamense]